MYLNEFIGTNAVYQHILSDDTDNAANLIKTIIEAMEVARDKKYLEQPAIIGRAVESYMQDICDEYNESQEEIDSTAEIESHLIDAQESAHQGLLQ